MVRVLKPDSNIYQLNTHKSRISLHTLIDQCFNGKSNIALIQEPPLKNGSVIGFPPPLSCLQTGQNPRAIILHNPSLEIWQLPHLSDRDCQTSIWRGGFSKPIILISAYWDINFPTIPPLLKKAVTEAAENSYGLILGIDANAHHPAWGSPNSNVRGHLMETFLNDHNLNILNEGNKPTFHRINCNTHIDITAASNAVIPLVRRWEVLEEEMFSDHSCLHTTLNPAKTFKRKYLNLKKTDWSIYVKELNKVDWPKINLTSATEIEENCNYLTEHLNKALTAATPIAYITGTHRKESWWTEDLRQLRRELRSFPRSPNFQSPNQIEKHKTLKANYTKMIRKAKRESWLKFTGEIHTLPEASRLTKILTTAKGTPLGLTNGRDGTPAWNKTTSTRNLMLNLFPGLTTSPPQLPIHIAPNDTTDISWITVDTVTSTIQQLQPNKAPGPDKITGRMLQNLPEKVISFLTNLYQHALKLEYIPDNWCESKAIFIPKNNKLPKNDPKAYRPICLSSTVFKVLEKLIQTHLERLNIYPAKLSQRQHGFRPNRSTLTALSELINNIEWGYHRHESTVATFLDIHGAFDNIDPFRALDKLEKWRTPTSIINTLKNYYRKRKVVTQLPLSNQNLTFYPTKGTAQGNVLSPMLWNCVVDKIGSIMDKHNVGGCIFADDVAITASNANTDIAISLIQKTLDDIAIWAQQEGLELNVSKTHSLLFNSPTENLPPPLTWKGQQLSFQETTKYLGVMLNNKLRWLDHFKMVFDMAKRDMVIINKALHRHVGPSPKLLHWIYTGIIRPKITYAAHIWCGKISNYILDKKSRQIQRWALTKLGPIRENTPTAGLEMITKTTPLHIHLQEMALKTICNFKNIKINIITPPNGHLAKWLNILSHHVPLAALPCDKTTKTLSPQFTNKIPESPTDEGATIYTDGSKKGPDCGSGFIIQWDKETRLGMVYNGHYQSVFLSEIRAISMAVEKFLTENIQTPSVRIYSDCKSAIAALKGKYASSKMIQQCWANLSKLDNAYKWSLSWVKAHVGIKGNEAADSLAKQASQMTHIGPQPILPLAPNYLRHELISFSHKNWETYWNGRVDCKQTKLWFPSPNSKESLNLLNLSKNDFGLMVRWITGHCFLARHEALINNGDPICNKCFIDDQTPWHLLKECPATLHLRSDLPHDKWTTGILLKIIKNITYLEVNNLLYPTPNY